MPARPLKPMPSASPGLRSGRWRRLRRRRSAWSRRGAPCSRAPARAGAMSAHLPCGGVPFSFSILRTVSRNSRNSPARRADHMACHDRGGGLSQRAGLHVMGEVGDHGPVHLEVDLDSRTAQFGVGGGAGVGVGEAAEAGDIARQFDDPLVVDVVQHEIRCPGRRCGSALGGWVSSSYIWTATAEKQPGRLPKAAGLETNSAAVRFVDGT